MRPIWHVSLVSLLFGPALLGPVSSADAQSWCRHAAQADEKLICNDAGSRGSAAMAVTALVDARIPLVWAALIIGGATLVIGLVLLAIGVSRLKAARPVPTRTIAQLEQDA
jgi:hypothetical protein